ncbi:MAG TPA: T9SS type A sorting domain-containing protein, partial [Saprospiraceae bacterium]|nr:T9SS type A sorting domain-containing protein [Saprospiraceae bacterium]
ENVKTIKSDGGNRKWFGTDNGVFVQSADAKTLVYKFDTKNSPLPSNSITSMAINPDNGECWIGTSKGLAVYRMESTVGGPTHKSEVYAFPNPVRPDYAGNIIITGLAVDSDVKITDTNGKLVYQTNSIGGQAVWDGNDYNGRRANTGVYLVFATGTSDPENPNGLVTKILFFN